MLIAEEKKKGKGDKKAIISKEIYFPLYLE